MFRLVTLSSNLTEDVPTNLVQKVKLIKRDDNPFIYIYILTHVINQCAYMMHVRWYMAAYLPALLSDPSEISSAATIDRSSTAVAWK